MQLVSRDVSVSTALGYALDGWPSVSERGNKLFSTAHHPSCLHQQLPEAL
jgi:hypothetical protein